MTLARGDCVRFVKAHHAMNPILKTREGDTGRIRIPPEPHDRKALVQFYTSDLGYGSWWIAESRLEKIE